MTALRAGEISKAMGIAKDTLRYYEKEGFISKPARSANGYRQYGQQHIKEIKFIRFAQSVGFPLSKIKLAIPHLDNPKPDCPILRRTIEEQLQSIEQKIDELNRAKSTLLKWIAPHSDPV